MQNPQMAAQMANMNAGAGPLDGTTVMGNGQRQPGDPRDQLNTYIYDYFIRTENHKLAKAMLDADMTVNLKPKSSPSGRNVNGVGPGDLPEPNMPPNQNTDTSFLLDWWVQFWDIFSAARGIKSKGSQYIAHARNVMQAQHDNRNQRMTMQSGMNGAQYQNMMRAMPNGAPPNDLKRAAAMNNRPNGNPMANMNQMKNQAMMSAQMQRDGSQMEMNGQRPQSPGSNENGGSPNKRQRVEGTHSISPRTALARSQSLRQAYMDHSRSEANHVPFAGAMNAGNMPGNQFGEFAQQGQNAQQKQIEVYAQSLAQQQRMALNNHQGMNNVAQGSPMNQSGLPGEGEIFVGNQPRPAGMPAGGAPPQGNHALQDYQMQLMLLEQQNKKRLLMARQEQDSMSGQHAQGPGVGPGFPPNMSPQGSRAGPSPNPSDQMKKGATPRMGPQGLPGSPMPEGAMQPQRNSPAPGVAFDPNTMPPGMPPQFANYPNGMNPQMMRPPSSHPQFNGQQVTQEQLQIMQRNQMAVMQNGVVWRGPQGQPGMMPGQQHMGPMGANPQQNRQMPPPPAPAGEQPRTEPSPSQPAAPPTPSQSSKGNPKKKNTKDNKKPANKKVATGATPAASGGEEPATPTAPITPVHPKSSFGGPNGQQQQPPQAAQSQQPAQQQPPPMDNNGPGAFGQLSVNEDPSFDNLGLAFDDSNTLENFDFDSFLHVGDDSTGFGSLGTDFGFGDIEAEAN
ncbi:camp-dependent protein kinase pathway protein [Paraphaeosphaeria minitans]|uniref:Camp-dependent protein kinase pathway protein n=1 Tax=Paraphaeosphaeria minitans TaxID=565426 RepID=A0A9P6G9F4_9PLEO|nr:camp-dependent protein kinase pathway protein [Paraphaeosphaeria minitans]